MFQIDLKRLSFLSNMDEIVNITHYNVTSREIRVCKYVQKHFLSEMIGFKCRQTARIRDSTIAFVRDDQEGIESIGILVDAIGYGYSSRVEPSVVWYDKQFTYAQFSNRRAKLDFIELIGKKAAEPDLKILVNRILKAVSAEPEHRFLMHPIVCQIKRIKLSIDCDWLRRTIMQLVGTSGFVGEFEASKSNSKPMARSLDVTFKIDRQAFMCIFGQERKGVIDYCKTYREQKLTVRSKFHVSIDCSFNQCWTCHRIGKHECETSRCIRCGSDEHRFGACDSVKKFCRNCNIEGHSARDIDCPYYLEKMVDILANMDIPVEYFEQEDLRHQLISYLIF